LDLNRLFFAVIGIYGFWPKEKNHSPLKEISLEMILFCPSHPNNLGLREFFSLAYYTPFL
jgi:hypothetical protein